MQKTATRRVSLAAGQGNVDFGHFVSSLKDAGFVGPLVTHGLMAAEAPGVHDFLRSLLLKHGCLA